MCLWGMLNDVSLRIDVLSSHIENHGRTATVFDGSVASELDQIRCAENGCNVVARGLDFLDLLDSEA